MLAVREDAQWGKRLNQKLGGVVGRVGWVSQGSFFALILFLAASDRAWGLDASNVLVLYNAANPDSVQIANYYAQKRPGVRLLGLNDVPAGEQITESVYRSVIRPQVLAAVDSTVEVIVTTKGLPLRVYNDQTPPSFPHTYTDPQGVVRTIYATSYKRYSSLESELSRIVNFSTWKQMGDQTFWFPPEGFNPARNPYYRVSSAFSHTGANYGELRLAARLDGFTTDDVLAAIDRAQNVFIVPRGQNIIVDNSPSAVAAGVTSMASLVNNVLAPRGQSHVYDTQTAPVFTSSKPVMGYVSHGTNDGSGQLQPTYLRSQLAFTLAKGAVMHTWESYNGFTFVENGNQGQGLIGDWLRAGGTAGIAHVQEPGADLSNVTNEDRLFEMLLNGYSWVEAAWNATKQVSYVNTVVGDPLMVWRPWLPGDANLDGVVDTTDLGTLAGNWQAPAAFSGGDFDFDGWVTISDLGILATNWQAGVSLPGSSLQDALAGVGLGGVFVPEPAVGGVLAAGSLLAMSRRHRPLVRSRQKTSRISVGVFTSAETGSADSRTPSTPTPG